MTQDRNGTRGLNAWLDRIRDQELPIFGKTAERIRDLTDSEKSAVSELADAILCDQGMTAKLLRIANSVIFNTSGSQVTTVSRAIVTAHQGRFWAANHARGGAVFHFTLPTVSQSLNVPADELAHAHCVCGG